MKTPKWQSRLLSVLYFPDSEYLAAKWWHRLATVITWVWLIGATAVAIGQVWDVWAVYEPSHNGRDSYERTEHAFSIALGLLSFFVPIVVYRVLLFFCIGSAWKGEPAR